MQDKSRCTWSDGYIDQQENIFMTGDFYSSILNLGCTNFLYNSGSNQRSDIFVAKFNSLSVSIDKIEKKQEIYIHPNPNNGSFEIFCNRKIDIGILKIFNGIGEIVYSDFYSGNKKIIQTKLTSGIYFVQVNFSNGQLTSKIIIE